MIELIEKTRSSSRIWKMAPAERQLQRLAHHRILVIVGIDRVVDFLGRLPDQEQAAGDQDQVAPGEAMAEGGEHRRRQLDDDRDGGKQHQPHDQRRRDAQLPGAGPLRLRQFVGQDRDEDQIVDAEHDLQHHQRQQRDPGGRVVDEGEMRRQKLDHLHGRRPPMRIDLEQCRRQLGTALAHINVTTRRKAPFPPAGARGETARSSRQARCGRKCRRRRRTMSPVRSPPRNGLSALSTGTG